MQIFASLIFAIKIIQGKSCIHGKFYRNGSNYGNKSFFPSHDITSEPQEILESFPELVPCVLECVSNLCLSPDSLGLKSMVSRSFVWRDVCVSYFYIFNVFYFPC